jgi:hypothetical protein
MPKKDIDYSKTIIYKLVCKDLLVTDVYVGHTTNFTERKRCHKSNCNNENDKGYNYKIYQTIRDNGNWTNWDMIQVEEYCCNNNNEATARERYWYETLNANMNTFVPNRSQNEWIETNKEHIKNYHKEYKKTNNDEILKNKKIYRDTNKEQIKEHNNKNYVCECGGKYIHINKARHFKSKKHINFISSIVSL